MPTRTILLNRAEQVLAAHGVPDARLDAEYLLAHVLGLSRMAMRLDMSRNVPDEQAQAFEALIAKRKGRIPLQHLMGYEEFMGLRFKSDARALIPRPETELLCERAIAALKRYPAPRRVLDLCTGTGAIGLAMKALNPDIDITLTDLSQDALDLAKENAALLSVQATLLSGDLFAPVAGQTFHLIVSNPPYIPHADCLQLQQEVKREPLMALDGGRDGLDFYRRIANEAKDHLVSGGMLLMEIGFDQGESVPALFDNAYTGLQVFEDYAHLPRMVQAIRK